MKKRIISLILVVVTVLLAFTGCAYNYAKDDMAQYATLNPQKLYEALHSLVIADEGFGLDEDARDEKVQDAIAAAILKVTDSTEKLFAGKVEKYDSLYFCYYATDADGNVFYSSKMDLSKPTNLQVGLLSLKDLNKAISKGVIDLEGNIEDYLYSTSADTVVGKDDFLSISYTKTWKDGETDKPKTETKSNFYFDPSSNAALAEKLIGKQVGVALEGEIKVTENEVECTYTDVKVESIIKDNSTDKVEANDVVYVTYTMSFNAKEHFFNTETNEYELPAGYSKDNLDDDGNYKATFTFKKLTLGEADAENATAEEKTFKGQLVGKNAGTTTSSITIKNDTVGDKTVEVKYTNVKVNCIVNSTTEGFTVKYTPYTEALNENESNKKTETNDEGVKVVLNGKELTYHIFPVYYIDVENVTAKLIIREFYSALVSTQTKEHDHTEEDHEHETEYVFDTLNDTEYKNNGKTLAELALELKTLNSTNTTKQTNLTNALKALTTAQSNLAKDDKAADSETADLKSKLVNAETAYHTAKTEADTAEQAVEDKIDEILACKKGEKGIEEGIVADYTQYQYDTLESEYNASIKTTLSKEIINYLNKNVTYTGELPKKAVKNAYKSLMNTYKYTFYEKYYNSKGEIIDSATEGAETIYSSHDGNFDAFLIKQVTGKTTGTMDDAEAALWAEAEKTVKGIIIIYVFADAIEAEWNTEIYLTRAEKKEIKSYYGLDSASETAIDVYYHAAQFDKIMDYLLEEKDTEGLKVEFANIGYDFPKDK